MASSLLNTKTTSQTIPNRTSHNTLSSSISPYAPTSSSAKTSQTNTKNTDYDRVSGTDYDLINQYKTAYDQAQAAGDQAGMDAAHDAAEAIRSGYGYSGGVDGSQYTPTGYVNLGGIFATEEPLEKYSNPYQSQQDALLQQILNPEAFSYNPLTDPSYLALQEQYTAMGQQAMEDTIGKVSARTGGLASSYATSASNQAYNSYMDALSGKQVELEQQAYDRYQDDIYNDVQAFNMLSGVANTGYNQYRDTVGDYRYQNEWNYGVGQDTKAEQQYNDQLALDNSRYEQEWNYGVEQDQRQQLEERAAVMAQYGDFTGFLQLGYSQADIDKMKAQWDLENAPSGGGGGGSYSGSGGSSPSAGWSDNSYAESEMTAALKQGWSPTEVGQLVSDEYNKGTLTDYQYSQYMNALQKEVMGNYSYIGSYGNTENHVNWTPDKYK